MVWEILLDRLAGLRGGEHVTRDVRLIGIPMAVTLQVFARHGKFIE